ncbi:hypothetical protein [Thermocatellispora tengchongensis]|uniref:hypothetical protein n=1 Tax=Thermocatellispora tengchongensis TaxID=1073253 RepID=UPI003634E197
MDDVKVVLGVDAGGTSTRAMVASPDGLRAARASGPGGNPSARGVEAACAAIAGAVTRALEAYGGGPEIAAAVLGVAGHEPFLTGAGREARCAPCPWPARGSRWSATCRWRSRRARPSRPARC